MARKVPAYRLHKTSGRAVVTLNSREIYLGRHGSKESKKAYRDLIREWEATGCSTSFGFTSTKTVTLAMLVADYRDFAKDYYPKRYNSESATIRLATDFLTDYLDLNADQFSPLKLKAVREKMLAAKHHRTGSPQSRVYVNRLIQTICRMFRWGAENELVQITTHQALSNVSALRRGRCDAPETEAVKPIDDTIVDATIPHCGPIVADMIRVQRLTAMRPAEVCALTLGVIDRSGKTWIARLAEHKTAWRGQSREVYFGQKAQAILSKYIVRPLEMPLFSPAESEEMRRAKLTEQRVTPPNVGNCPGTNRKKSPARKARDSYDTNSYRRAIHRACDSAFPAPDGYTESEVANWQAKHRWSPNQLRHSAATRIRKDHGLEAAQVILGHTHADVTQIYAETDRARAIEIAALIG